MSVEEPNSTTSPTPFVRLYVPADFDAAENICVETLAPSLKGSEPAARIGPYLWTHQYTTLSPRTCFVLDDGTGRAVGYCIGSPDIHKFVSDYPRFVDEILIPKGRVPRPDDAAEQEPWTLEDGSINETSLAQLAYNPHWLLIKGNEDLINGQEYRSTLHIDLLPEWQGSGWGRALLERFVSSVAQADRVSNATRGVWIGVAGDNGKVVPFYEKCGFRRVEGKGEGIRMVLDLEGWEPKSK